MLEKHVERRVRDWAQKNGIQCYKFVSPAHRSVPDRLFILPNGWALFIEFKAPGKKPTPLQSNELNRINCYVPAVWSDDPDAAINLLERMLQCPKIKRPSFLPPDPLQKLRLPPSS